MTVDFLGHDDAGDSINLGSWDDARHIPRIGEEVSLNDKDLYVVTMVSWNPDGEQVFVDLKPWAGKVGL